MRTRERKITVRMTEDEYQKYQTRLEKSKLKNQEYGLRCLLNHPINVVENMPELIRQLKAIGNNLNQIARAANAGQAMPPVVTELEQEVSQLWQLLKSLQAKRP